MSEEEVTRVLEELFREATKTKKPAIGRLATVQSMVDLGLGWHDYRDVQKRLQFHLATGSTFMFQLVARYPQVFEKDSKYQVRIAPSAFPFVKKQVMPMLRKLGYTKRQVDRPKTT